MDKRNGQGFAFYPGRRLPVLCRDGRERIATATGFGSHVLPAAVQVSINGKRRTVSGFVYVSSYYNPGRYCFTATGRNADLMPWTNHRPAAAAIVRRLFDLTAGGFIGPRFAAVTPEDHCRTLARFCLAAATVNGAGGFAYCRKLPDVAPGHDRSHATATVAAVWPAVRRSVRKSRPEDLIRAAALVYRVSRFAALMDD